MQDHFPICYDDFPNDLPIFRGFSQLETCKKPSKNLCVVLKLSTSIFETMIQPQITRDRFIMVYTHFPQMHVVHVFPFFLPGDPTCFYMFFPTCQVRVSRFNKGASLLLIPPLCPPLSFSSSSLAALAAFAEWMPDRMPERTSQ